MEKALKKLSPGKRSSLSKVVRLYPGKKPVQVTNKPDPSPPQFPHVQMPPQPEAYLKFSEFDFF